ncbi:AAA family ATPase [Sphingomonas baiyangensis]|uniref:non-specific protein-tyrosine kinase n=1 Tax=Sphingomonas baiyangensis TaxID=2572576 RepID=A0A4U1L234_9SPHN|nr:AAA family ATPase [Sphingomonas baiyangensis]TKD50927.1 exopolysaccharide biosynthesis protein [Sphingomonas baiyangensis]
MNAHTPNRLKGSLLERATGMYDYAPPPPVIAPRHDPVPPPLAETEGWDGADAVSAPPPVDRRVAIIEPSRLADAGLLVPGAAVTPLAEEFRLVKRQLLVGAAKLGDEPRARAMLVCSAKPGDGKTFCAANLGLSMAAEKDVEILLVDADVAKPDLLNRLGVADGPGLLDAVADPTRNVEELIVETDVPQLLLLPAGTRGHADTELLSSERARVVIASLMRADKRRIVIFDSPPALAASPAVVLASLVGQVMLVVRADRTSEADVRDAVSRLSPCDNIQLLLNGVTLRPDGTRFGDYYGYGDPA